MIHHRVQSFAIKKLQREFADINEKSDVPFTVGLVDENDFFTWEVLIIGPEGTIYENGIFRAVLRFPQDYPNNPPKMTFTSKMWHPNIFKNGAVCISILHPPVVDVTNPDERLDEKWRPVLGVKEVLLSVMSMLIEPNLDSPANIDAAVEFKSNPQAYKQRIRCYMESENGCQLD